MTFLFLFHLAFSTGASNSILKLFFRADSQRGLALLNSCSLHDTFEIHLLVIDDSCLMKEGDLVLDPTSFSFNLISSYIDVRSP